MKMKSHFHRQIGLDSLHGDHETAQFDASDEIYYQSVRFNKVNHHPIYINTSHSSIYIGFRTLDPYPTPRGERSYEYSR